MTSKKRTGDDPEALQGSGKAQAPGLEGIDALVGIRGPGKTSEYMNGRRSLAYELHDKGLLSSQKLAMEILFLLPDDFIQFYQALFHQALVVGDGSVMHGKSGGLGKAKGAQGIVTGSEVGNQAKGSGKRWKNPAYTVGNEDYLEVKTWVDKELRKVVRGAVDMARRVRDQRAFEKQTSLDGTAGNSGTNGNSGTAGARLDGRGQTRSLRCPGLRAEWVDKGDGVVRPKCNLFVKAEWRFCPTCGYRLVRTSSEQVD